MGCRNRGRSDVGALLAWGLGCVVKKPGCKQTLPEDGLVLSRGGRRTLAIGKDGWGDIHGCEAWNLVNAEGKFHWQQRACQVLNVFLQSFAFKTICNSQASPSDTFISSTTTFSPGQFYTTPLHIPPNLSPDKPPKLRLSPPILPQSSQIHSLPPSQTGNARTSRATPSLDAMPPP